jgi:GxxExxY protein
MNEVNLTAENAEVAEVNEINKLTSTIIGAAIAVHRELGPGLLESSYEACLCYELVSLGISVERQLPVPLRYRDITLDCGYRADLVVAGKILVEAKSIEALLPIHDAQLLSYLRLGGWQVGLLINFNVTLLRQGIRRRVLNLKEQNSASSAISAVNLFS